MSRILIMAIRTLAYSIVGIIVAVGLLGLVGGTFPSSLGTSEGFEIAAFALCLTSGFSIGCFLGLRRSRPATYPPPGVWRRRLPWLALAVSCVVVLVCCLSYIYPTGWTVAGYYYNLSRGGLTVNYQRSANVYVTAAIPNLWWFAVPPALLALALFDLTRLRELPDRCRWCGYSLIGLTEPRCPECANEFDPEKISTTLAVSSDSISSPALVGEGVPINDTRPRHEPPND